MTISPPEREAKKVKIVVDRNPVETSFEKWAKPGHFSRALSKGPTTTTRSGIYMQTLMILTVTQVT